MTVAVEASKDVDITRQGRFEYAVSTTGTDPQLILDKLAGAFNADSCVLTFEYRSDSTIRDVELYFAEPLSATRMMKASPIPASRVSGEETSGDSDAWAKWSVDLGSVSYTHLDVYKRQKVCRSNASKRERTIRK